MMMIMPMATGRGMGVYPTLDDGSANPCFDPNRPSWQPYWLDTTDEERCKHDRGYGPLGISVPITLPSFPGDTHIDPDGGVATTGGSDSYSGLIILGVGIVALLYFMRRR
jgi:hypothetical protein